jgi:hypothetical protein
MPTGPKSLGRISRSLFQQKRVTGFCRGDHLPLLGHAGLRYGGNFLVDGKNRTARLSNGHLAIPCR